LPRLLRRAKPPFLPASLIVNSLVLFMLYPK
jgi:hypothetical protein